VWKRPAGQTTFQTVDVSAGIGGVAHLNVVSGGTSAGVYLTGRSPVGWLIRKTSDAGGTWSDVGDSWPGQASGVCADRAGNLYVAGADFSDPNLGSTWTVRTSADGGISWSVADTVSSPFASNAGGVGTDREGNVYVVGGTSDSDGNQHALIRSNAGGNWTTADDYQSASTNAVFYDAFTTDSSGRLYASGRDGYPNGWLIRSAPGSAAQVTLDFSYLLTLAQHYNGPGTFTTGDLNNDGQVGFDDLLILAQDYGRTISATGAEGAATVGTSHPSARPHQADAIDSRTVSIHHHRRAERHVWNRRRADRPPAASSPGEPERASR
jgi:hypothetical protein